jgi:2-oxoglutarate dehydrogenase E2 component (dihydrolipoamide succinyltransferase)
MTEIRVPTLGESVTEATVGKWLKGAGDAVSVDEPLVELETDKVSIEVPAPAAGVLSEIAAKEGETIAVGALLGQIEAGGAAAAKSAPKPSESKPSENKPSENGASASSGGVEAKKDNGAGRKPEPAPQKPSGPAKEPSPREEASEGMPPAPAARKLMEEKGIGSESIQGSGRRGQILKEDVLAAARAVAETRAKEETPAPRREAPAAPREEAREERVRMTKLRQTIARRLKDAQETAAMLTTFNDVDMSAVMQLRRQYKDLFEKRHGVKLGFLGLFVKACVQALRDVPEVNAEIDGTDIVYKNYYNIGVAVGTERGLVVPVLRDADRMSLADIEREIVEFGARARDGKLSVEDMQGGTFTISNGGVFGSLMSTPILNAPQSGILGMHRIEDRAVVRDGEIVARPMMYLALSYDHRVVDGQGAVTFLVRVKEQLEDPHRLVLDL